MDLTDGVEVQVVVVERCQDTRTFSSGVAEVVVQLLLWCRVVTAALGAENEQKHRAVVAQCEPGHLPARRVVGDVDQFVVRPVSVDHARGHFAAEVVFEFRLRAKDQATHVGMLSVCADDEVEIAVLLVVERHTRTVVRCARYFRALGLGVASAQRLGECWVEYVDG